MSGTLTAAPPGFDVAAVRAAFPALAVEAHGHPLAYLDNAATSQKPQSVLEALDGAYRSANANVHRGVHLLAERATQAYEAARARVAAHLGAAAEEIVFTRGTTESINLVAQAYLRPRLAAGDEVLISHLEHHSNIVPWQLVCEATGARLRVASLDANGDVDVEAFAALLGPRTRLVALAHVSNALGTVLPIRDLAALARDQGVPVLVDGAQAVPHQPVDVRALGVDFYAFSGHKAFGPTGIGVLFGRGALLAETGPWQGGGEMIRHVTFERTTYAPPPARFEAGTPNFIGAVGLAAAIDFLASLDAAALAAHEAELLAAAVTGLGGLPGVHLVGTPQQRSGVVGFTVEGVHPHDVGTVLDRQGIAVRAGHHCAQPALEHFGVGATVRASFALYNTLEEIDRLLAGVRRAQEIFAA